MVSDKEIEAAKRYLPLATDETIRVALEAAARVRAENDAFQDAVVTGLGAVKMNADGTTERIDLQTEADAGEPVAWAYELANFYTKDRGYYDFGLQISKVDPRKTWEIAPDRIRNIRPLYTHPTPQPSGKIEEAVQIIQAFIDQEVDYMMRNNLGNPEKQHNVKWGRKWLSSLTAEPYTPEGRQDDKPRAYIIHAPEDDCYGTGSISLQFHPLAQHDMDKGYRQTPLYEHPAHELSGNNGELTDAMIEAALNEYIYGDHDTPEEAMLAALKAAMAAGRRTIGIKNVDKLLKV